MRITKHIGKHNNQKAIIAYRQIPGEEHMCLLIYPDKLPNSYHDEVIKVVESEVGQQAKELADALFRHVMSNGNNCLESLHREGFLKKVPANQVVVTPNAKSSIRLDELNKILNEMDQGDAAVKRLAELDANQGMVTPPAPREVGASPVSRSNEVDVNTNVQLEDVLTDEQLAKQRIAQATRMKAEANQLLHEAARLEAEAQTFIKEDSVTDVKPKTAAKKTAKKTTTAKPSTKRQREVAENNS